MDIQEIARICHEVNRGLCIGLGDNSQPAWEDAPDWQKESAVNGVTAIVEGRVNAPEDSHNGWSREKIEAGWTYGEVKDPAAKTHPCLVPFHDLPPAQQLKDMLFLQTVWALR